MQGADFILDSLVKEGIDHLFMVPGGLIDPFLPALGRHTALTPIVAAQEGGAAYMADGYARASGRFGVALCIGGPGLGNAVTAVAAAQTDGSPLLLLSGEVATDMEGLGEFQDAGSQTLDDVSILKPLTRYSTSIANPRNLPHLLRRALIQLRTAPTGPVHLSIPTDSQRFDLDARYRPIADGLIHARTLALDAAMATLAHFTQGPDGKPPVRIVILAGAGIEHARCSTALLVFAQRWSIPVATTLRAKGAFPEDHPLSLGVFGYAGTHHSRLALLDDPPDLLLLLGSGLNERDTMHWALRLRAQRTICVNLSTVVMGAHLTDSCVVGDAGAYLDWLAAHDDRIGPTLEDTRVARGHWLAGITAQPRLQDPQHCASDATPLHPARAISELRTALPKDGIVLIDSGAHRAFAGHYWTAYAPLTYLSATNLGPMGWAIPAAIGAQCARPDRRVAVITGDGCMRMQGMEIATAARYRLPIIYLVINNAALGNVWLRAHTLGAVPDELTSLPDHDWAGFSRGLGGCGITVSRPEQLAGAFAVALENQGPTVIDVKADKRFATPVQDWSAACAAWSYHE
ncbi:thiamine pyrophosphate-binding protein [Candidatus Thiodictyon syntrophicum]|uniref:Thiamine pyrophosphate-binding protein n=1 Tax=Candidatus Thiodictyon syntrophicum TaxID=1166950 RepID=A0A2K8U771_9GAMM|nr:thiamine pyrophosphate-binding protein [Candidatus Thiodictyon syntrophicum]AUB81440.1 thiamine pyrophosphate-binding protein [Candidatus Thiodictyon syntrophicum]